MLFLSQCSWNMCQKIKLLMEKHTDYIGIICGMPFWQLFFFFYIKKETASGTCFCGAKLVSLSLFDLFQMSVCLQCWTQPFSVLWKLKEAECSVLEKTLSANLQRGHLIGRGIDSSWGMPTISVQPQDMVMGAWWGAQEEGCRQMLRKH